MTLECRFLLFVTSCIFVSVYAEIETRATTVTISVEDQCKKAYGNMSYFCRDKYSASYDYLCDDFYCFYPSFRTCVTVQSPPDNSACGNGKWCLGQACRVDSNAANTTDACPLGDSANPKVMFGRSCSDLVATRPSACYDQSINRTWCCESCANITVPTPATFTGPALSAADDCRSAYGNDSYFCMQDPFYGNSLDSRICQNMFCHDSYDGTCKNITASDGVPCGANQWCVGGQCVPSTNAPSNPARDCLYGNRWEGFCKTIQYPQVAQYCSQSRYEEGCCETCYPHKNNSAKAGCEYGDIKPDVCMAQKKAGTASGYCASHEVDCCETCGSLKSNTNKNCPFGDADPVKCKALMNDTLGTGNCYNVQHKRECCDTCPEYFNASRVGCEYGDHWQEWCSINVVPPKVATMCGQYESQCCKTCKDYQTPYPGCKYGDRDPVVCAAMVNSTHNCYDFIQRTQCCETCAKLNDPSTPSCLYGDRKPAECQAMMAKDYGKNHCYNIQTQVDCCRTCEQEKNTSNVGCEFGDHLIDYCSTNIRNTTAFLCFSYEQQCCESCAELKLSDLPDCKFGDKNPYQCQFRINSDAAAASLCPSMHTDCCETCSKFGHPGPGGGIDPNVISAKLVG